MPASLIDTSVWVALAFDAHPAHEIAVASFGGMTSSEPAVFCRSTQQSFLRLSTTPRILHHYGAEAVDNSTALESLRRFLGHSSVAFREESPGLEPIWHQLAERSTVSPKVWMDAYLAAFAISGGLRLITLDKDFKSFVGAGLDLLLLEV